MPLHYFKQNARGNNPGREPSGWPAHANESAANGEAGSRKAEDEGGGERKMRVVTACDNSCEIVSFIIGVITITVISL